MAGLNQIGQISIPVRNLERSIAFYRDTLGMRFLFQAPPGLAFFMCGEVRLMLAMPEGGEFGAGTSILYYKVDDLQNAFAEIRERGAAVAHEPQLIARMPDHELWMAFFKDPDENVFGLMSEVRATPAGR